MRETDWTKILGWPGYRVYRDEINEEAKTLKLWVRRTRGNRKLVCSGCGRKLSEVYDTDEREVRDLPCFEFRTTVVIELYRVGCSDCGVKTEKVPQLPSKAPFSKRLEEAVGLACESAAVRRVARQFWLSPSTARAMDVRYLKRWAASRRKPALRQMCPRHRLPRDCRITVEGILAGLHHEYQLEKCVVPASAAKSVDNRGGVAGEFNPGNESYFNPSLVTVATSPPFRYIAWRGPGQ
jgi:zinc-finger of transposase IS204/IS1001/IS1096/IS1165/Helix-turn-helix domain of transposase family ISL3